MDDGHLIEPYVGGYNSQHAKMLMATFKPMEEIVKLNPRWTKSEKGFREMVEDMQTLMLTGGVKSNMFR